MARRDLTGLLQLLEAYRQFSPEQALREKLMQSQIDTAGQGLAESRYNLGYRQQTDPLNLELLGQSVTGAKNENSFNAEANPLRLEAMNQGNKLTAEQILSASLGNQHASKINPLELKAREDQLPLQTNLLRSQVTGVQNENSLFDQRKAMADLNVKDAQQQLQMQPKEAASMQASRAAQTFAMLSQVGYDPRAIGSKEIGQQNLLRGIAGDSLPPEVTPNINLFSNMPNSDRQAFAEIMSGVNNNKALIQALFQKYPEAAVKLIPNKRPQ